MGGRQYKKTLVWWCTLAQGLELQSENSRSDLHWLYLAMMVFHGIVRNLLGFSSWVKTQELTSMDGSGDGGARVSCPSWRRRCWSTLPKVWVLSSPVVDVDGCCCKFEFVLTGFWEVVFFFFSLHVCVSVGCVHRSCAEAGCVLIMIVFSWC